MGTDHSFPKLPDRAAASALSAARAGDAEAFASLAEPYRRELMTHCYRMLGSLQDAEDLVQETYVRAWRRLETYAGRASFRAWLYRIATNACLDVLDRRPKRTLPNHLTSAADPAGPLPLPVTDPIWIEPFPDELFFAGEPDPEARIEARESISLAFLVALHVLPPRQRCILILGDVLDWPVPEMAEMLGISVSAVNSLLHRARAALKQQDPFGRKRNSGPLPDRQTEQLLNRYVRSWETADIDGIVSLLTQDAAFPMPPVPAWFQGPTAVRAFLSGAILAGDARGRWRLLPLHANGQPGFALYQLEPADHTYHPYAIQVLALEGDRIREAVTFLSPALFRFFDLPQALER